jgi:glycosyltransferase involved in cell wall biosynthesis
MGQRHWWLHGIRRAIRETGAELFHGTNFEVPYMGATPAVMTIHDLSPWRDPAWHSGPSRVRKRTPWLLRLRRARIILTVSEAVRREVIEYFGLAAGRVRSVPLAASPDFAYLPHSGPASERPFFLFVGTLEPRKNVAGVVEAWRATRAETGADLMLAGRTRADFAPIANAEGLVFAGEVPDRELPFLYSRALAFVYPSHYEGFGLPVLEAMQCGCPVITSNDPAIMEVSGGAAIHAGTALELADALRGIARDSGLREELRRAGLVRARCFSWQRTARHTRDIYAEAIL